MDRRSVLLGSGTALALTLAGCMGDGDGGGSDDEPDEDVQTGGRTEDDDDNGDGGMDDLPGIDESDLDQLSEYITVRKVALNDRTLRIEADVKRDSKKEAMTELGHGLRKSVTDMQALMEKVDWIEVVLYDSGEKVFKAKMSIDWMVMLVEDEIDPETLAEELQDQFGDDFDDEDG